MPDSNTSLRPGNRTAQLLGTGGQGSGALNEAHKRQHRRVHVQLVVLRCECVLRHCGARRFARPLILCPSESC